MGKSFTYDKVKWAIMKRGQTVRKQMKRACQDEKLVAICRLVEDGFSWQYACDIIGLRVRTVLKWKKQGRQVMVKIDHTEDDYKARKPVYMEIGLDALVLPNGDSAQRRRLRNKRRPHV